MVATSYGSDKRLAESNAWVWPNVVHRPFLWALAGILLALGTLALLAIWPLALLGLVAYKAALILTAIVLTAQLIAGRAGRRIAERQIAAEGTFKAAAVSEFGEEAADQFRALERGELGPGAEDY